jgi:hypothetical protein
VFAASSADAAFGRTTGTLPPGIERIPVCLEPIPILVGRWECASLAGAGAGGYE